MQQAQYTLYSLFHSLLHPLSSPLSLLLSPQLFTPPSLHPLSSTLSPPPSLLHSLSSTLSSTLSPPLSLLYPLSSTLSPPPSLLHQVQAEVKRKWRRWLLQRYMGSDSTKYQQPSSNGNTFSTQISMLTKCSPVTRRVSSSGPEDSSVI